jgi:small subunit ribosomal protein S3
MGQKTHPIGFRVGITEDHRSKWFAPKSAFGEFLVEDYQIRKLLDERLNRRPPFAAVSDIVIERTREEVTVTIKTARPGLVIGPKGAEVDKLREAVEDLIHRRVAPIKVVEIKNPDLNAQLVAEGIAEQLKRRASFRRVLKMRCEASMNAGARGIRIQIGGRLNGAEIARSHKLTVGSVPLTTLQANIDYGYAISNTKAGTIGVKCWVYKGRYGSDVQDTDVRPGGPPRRGGRRG